MFRKENLTAFWKYRRLYFKLAAYIKIGSVLKKNAQTTTINLSSIFGCLKTLPLSSALFFSFVYLLLSSWLTRLLSSSTAAFSSFTSFLNDCTS